MTRPPFKDHFSGHAESYARYRPAYPPALFAYLAARAPGRVRAWDCATGGGQAARGLAPHFNEVIATDASVHQIAHATGPANVRFMVARAEASGLASGSVDLIAVAQALHWFALEAFYGEARRLLRPNGILAAWCYALFTSIPAVDRVVRHLYHDVVGPYWPPERDFLDAGYATLAFPFQPMPAPEFIMQHELTPGELTGYLRTWSAVQRYMDHRGVDPVAGIESELARVWPRDRERLAVRWRLHLKVGRCRWPATVAVSDTSGHR